MDAETLAAALEREHHEIDDGIEAFTAGLGEGAINTGPLTQAMDALRRHIYLEEEFLFPPLRDAGMVMPIFVMIKEHGEIWDTMDALDAALAEDPGSDAVRRTCGTLLEQLARHNEKEEPIVYPQADATLSPEVHAGLTEFIRTGTMPAGWVCERAAAAQGSAAPGSAAQGSTQGPGPGSGRSLPF